MLTGYPLLIVFALSIAMLLLSIIKLRINPFIALLITSVLTAFMVRMPIAAISNTISSGFGGTLTGIGIVIGLGIIFGNILSESRATEAIANGLLRNTGKNHAVLAVATAGFLISIPVFMDAAFVIMMPIIKYISKATKKPLISFVCALGVGTIVGHAIVIPTPGPLAVADKMNANVGYFILYSLIVAFPATLIGGWLYASWLGRKSIYEEAAVEEAESAETAPVANAAPSFGLALFALLFPICLILVANVLISFLPGDAAIVPALKFVGDKNIALLLGVLVSFAVLKRHVTKAFTDIVVEAADSAGLILLITGAGGAFGSVINASGIGGYLVETMSAMSIPVVVLGFVLSALLRVSQGSTTVALVTTASILGPSVALTGDSPILVGLAICAGGVGLSLPNDSGFWVLNRFSGLSVRDTLRSWTAGGTIAGFGAFAIVLVLDILNDMIGLPGLS